MSLRILLRVHYIHMPHASIHMPMHMAIHIVGTTNVCTDVCTDMCTDMCVDMCIRMFPCYPCAMIGDIIIITIINKDVPMLPVCNDRRPDTQSS